jgi:hypothetical protein
MTFMSELPRYHIQEFLKAQPVDYDPRTRLPIARLLPYCDPLSASRTNLVGRPSPFRREYADV